MEESIEPIKKIKKIRWILVILIAVAFIAFQIGQMILFDVLGVSIPIFSAIPLDTSLILIGITATIAFLLGLVIPFWEKEYAKDNALMASLLILIYRILFEAASLGAVISWFLFIAIPMFIGAILMKHFKK